MYILFLNLLDEFYLPSEFGVIIIILKIQFFSDSKIKLEISGLFYSIDREKPYQKLQDVFFFISSPKGRKTAPKVMKTGFSPTLSKVWSREKLEKIPDYSP